MTCSERLFCEPVHTSRGLCSGEEFRPSWSGRQLRHERRADTAAAADLRDRRGL